MNSKSRMKRKMDWSGVFRWWKQAYFQIALGAYTIFLVAKAYTGGYATKHEFMNGFTQDLYNFIMTIPLIYPFIFLMAGLSLVVIQTRRGFNDRWKKRAETVISITLFCFLLTIGVFEPIRILLQSIMDISIFDVTIMKSLETFISGMKNSGMEGLFPNIAFLAVDMATYFIYVNLSLMYLLLPMAISSVLGFYMVVFMELKPMHTMEKVPAFQNVVPFKKKK